MRLWSIHPQYLDSKGLVALWREGLLAQACLAGKTKGYTNHPQLDRFKKIADPLSAVGSYLQEVVKEASSRNYNFDSSKIIESLFPDKIPVTTGQLNYEWQHFLRKVQVRDPLLHKSLESLKQPSPHPIFFQIGGNIEPWEKQ